ncbi:MAG: hypothetical protein ACREMA_06770, partial [Longimicrobiales bacterium]
IEGGFAVVRAAQEGLVTITDHRGRIVAQRASSESRDVFVAAAVAPGPGRTLYSVTGDWFGVTSVISALIVLVAATLRARRAETHTDLAASSTPPVIHTGRVS